LVQVLARFWRRVFATFSAKITPFSRSFSASYWIRRILYPAKMAGSFSAHFSPQTWQFRTSFFAIFPVFTVRADRKIRKLLQPADYLTANSPKSTFRRTKSCFFEAPIIY